MRLTVLLGVFYLTACITAPDGGLSASAFSSSPEPPSSEARAYAHYLAAIIYQRGGEPARTIEELEAAAALSPHSFRVLDHLAWTYLQNDEPEKALAVSRQAVQEAPENSGGYLILGSIYQRLERLDEAIEAYKEAIRLNPKTGMGYYQLVRLEETAHDLVGLAETYEKLVELQQGSQEVVVLHYELGKVLSGINDLEGAKASFLRVLEMRPQSTEARLFLARVYLGLNENEEAIKQYTLFLEHEKNHVEAIERLAAAYVRTQNYAKSVDLLTSIIEKGLAEPRHAVERMYVLFRAGQYDELSRLETPTDARIIGTLLQVLTRKSQGLNYRPFLETLDQVGGNPQTEWETYLAPLLGLYGVETEGTFLLQQLAEARQAGVRSKTLEMVYALVLNALKREKDAIDVLLPLLDSFGPDESIHYWLAVCYAATDDPPQAFEHFKAALELNPKNTETMNSLGYLYAEQNMNLDEAEKLLNEALGIEPENGYYLDSLGWVYYRKGDADRAIELIKKAIQAMDYDDAVLRDHLGDAYLLKGDTRKAVEQWRRARRLDPTLEGVQEKMDKHTPPPSEYPGP